MPWCRFLVSGFLLWRVRLPREVDSSKPNLGDAASCRLAGVSADRAVFSLKERVWLAEARFTEACEWFSEENYSPRSVFREWFVSLALETELAFSPLCKAEDNALVGQRWGWCWRDRIHLCASYITFNSFSKTFDFHQFPPNSAPISLTMKNDFKRWPLANRDIKVVQVDCLRLWWSFNLPCLTSALSPYPVANFSSKVLLWISHPRCAAGHPNGCSICGWTSAAFRSDQQSYDGE